MSAVMEDDKDADQESGRRDGQCQCQPRGDPHTEDHERPQDQIRSQGIENLKDTP